MLRVIHIFGLLDLIQSCTLFETSLQLRNSSTVRHIRNLWPSTSGLGHYSCSEYIAILSMHWTYRPSLWFHTDPLKYTLPLTFTSTIVPDQIHFCISRHCGWSSSSFLLWKAKWISCMDFDWYVSSNYFEYDNTILIWLLLYKRKISTINCMSCAEE